MARRRCVPSDPDPQTSRQRPHRSGLLAVRAAPRPRQPAWLTRPKDQLVWAGEGACVGRLGLEDSHPGLCLGGNTHEGLRTVSTCPSPRALGTEDTERHPGPTVLASSLARPWRSRGPWMQHAAEAPGNTKAHATCTSPGPGWPHLLTRSPCAPGNPAGIASSLRPSLTCPQPSSTRQVQSTRPWVPLDPMPPANTPSLPRLRQRPVPTHVEGAAPGLRQGCGCSTEMCLSSHGTGGGCPGDHLGLRLLNTSQHNYDEGGAHKRLARKERDHCPPGTSGLGRPSRGPPGAMPSRGDLRGSHRGWRPPKPASGQGPRPQPQASCTDSHKRKPYPPPCGGLRRWSGLEATRGPLRMGSQP